MVRSHFTPSIAPPAPAPPMLAPIPSLDPLLAALINKLPPSGSEWPAAARTDWLSMIEMAFNVVYGRDTGAAGYEPPVRSGGGEPASNPGLRAAPVNPPHHGHFFYIDAEGFARGPNARRIMPNDINADEMVYEYRRGTARDRDTVIWADGTVGCAEVPTIEFCGPG